jgi:hypothetical protein
VLMLAKATDIRLLRAEDPRITRQMLDLTPMCPSVTAYVPGSVARVNKTMNAESSEGGFAARRRGAGPTGSIDCVTETPAASSLPPCSLRLGIQLDKRMFSSGWVRDPARTRSSAGNLVSPGVPRSSRRSDEGQDPNHTAHCRRPRARLSRTGSRDEVATKH